MVIVFSVYTSPFFALSDLICQLMDTGIGVFWLPWAAW